MPPCYPAGAARLGAAAQAPIVGRLDAGEFEPRGNSNPTFIKVRAKSHDLSTENSRTYR